MKKLIYPLILCILYFNGSAQYANGKIKVYFDRGVDNAVESNYPAVQLYGTWGDTLAAYINRANISVDVACYDFTTSTGNPSINNIATAINAAYSRGVVVRWIYNGSSSNTGLTQLNSGIKTLASPTGSGYNIMHDKFVIIDASSTNPDVPIVWTGSPDWSQEMLDSDYNNIIIFQDSALAKAYTAQFNQMWGGTGASPVTANEKFGSHKADLGPHIFTIGGSEVELYFSPADSTNNHILDVINSANEQLFFAVYTFTESNDATAIVARKNAGVYTAGVVDSYSSTYSSWTTLTNGLGNMVKEYVEPTSQPYCLYHNKYVIADPCDLTSDPQVLTGSHNWTASADDENDENTVIIHNADVANIYYQAFTHDFDNIGTNNQLTPCTISNPCNITASATVNTNVLCAGQSTGKATVNAHGTHGPFTYSWSSVPAQTDSVLNNVAAGSYTVTVTDANSCTATASVTITQPSAISINSSVTDVSCLNGDNGSIAATASGGSGSYQYLWNTTPQQTTATASNLSAGSYTITVTDGHNCTATGTFSVTQPNSGITLSASASNASCGTNNGSVSVSVLTGTGPFTYQWTGGGTTATVSNLAAGSYTVTVSNTGGCSATASTAVNSSGGPSVVASSTNTTCGGANGTANVAVSGGSSPYTYDWSNGATTASISNLGAGTYTITVQDNNHCASIASTTVNASNGLVLNTSSTATTCGADNGSATVSVTNGSNPVYNWSNGGTTATINNIVAGNYNVTVTDGGSCSASASVTVGGSSGSGSFSITADKTTLCYGDSANLCAISGYTTYSWSNSASGTCIYVNQSGSYTVTASNNGGCSATSTPTVITVYPQLNITFGATGDTLIATSAVTYQWQLNGAIINGATNETYIATQSGNYSVVGTDANNCSATSSQKFVSVTGISNVVNNEFVNVYPNPLSGGNWQVEVSNDWIGSAIEIYDASGKLVFKSEVRSLKSEIAPTIEQGIYMMRITSNDRSLVKKLIKL